MLGGFLLLGQQFFFERSCAGCSLVVTDRTLLTKGTEITVGKEKYWTLSEKYWTLSEKYWAPPEMYSGRDVGLTVWALGRLLRPVTRAVQLEVLVCLRHPGKI